MNDTGCRLMQRVVSTEQFSHGKKRWKHNVLVQAKTNSGSGKEDLWYAEVLAIVKITARSGVHSEAEKQENVILRYYSALKREEYSRIDNLLVFIKLRWAVNTTEDPWIEGSPWKRSEGAFIFSQTGCIRILRLKVRCQRIWHKRGSTVYFMRIDLSSATTKHSTCSSTECSKL